MPVAFKIALRELRGGLTGFRLFLGCLVVGVTVIALVGTLAACVENGIRRESGSLLGGDVEISIAGAQATPAQQDFLRSRGRVSLTVAMRAMATFKEDSALVDLKGVDAEYPLLGQAELASPMPFQQALGQGRLVIDEALRERLGVKPGDSLIIGDAPFIVSGILRKEPDRIAGGYRLGPRVFASIPDLEKAGLLLPGNLIHYNYRLLLARPGAVDAFRREAQRRFPDAPWTLRSMSESNRTVDELVTRLQLFLTLAGLSSLLIGGVGIGNAVSAYIDGKAATIATFKAVGATRRAMLAIYVTVLSLVTLLGVAISAVLSLLLCAVMLPCLARFLPVSADMSASLKPLLLAASYGTLTMFTFSSPALARGMETKPALLFRAAAMAGKTRLTRGQLCVVGLLALLLIALVVATSGDHEIAGAFVVAALVCICVFSDCARAMGSLARRLRLRPGIGRLAAANLGRPGAPAFSIMLSIGIGLSVLVALLLVEGNIEWDIKESIPAQAPSLFLSDIQPSQKADLMALLASKPYVSDVVSEPMVRGRIAKLGGVPVERAPLKSEVKWATESDRGVSYSAAQPEGTRLEWGQWWPPGYHGAPLASLDRALADGMGLTLGNTITLNILGETLTATIVNLREVNYMSLRMNFALILSPGEIERFPFTTLMTLRVAGEKEEAQLVREVTKRFPNVASIRTRESLQALDEIVGHVVTAILITLLFTLASGAMVLGSALATVLSRRAYDTAMFKVLGARRRDILALFLIEWLTIACVTGVLSCLFGSAGAWLIIQHLRVPGFHLLFAPMAEALGAVLSFIACTGLLLHSRTFALKANVILRNE